VIRFIILSLGRSGSTSLASLINALYPGSVMLEPFNSSLYNGHYHKLAYDRGIADSLYAIGAKHRGVKHVLSPNGWPFPKEPQFNLNILSAPGIRFLLLVRNNLLQRIVSNEMAKSSQLWRISSIDESKRLAANKFPCIDLSLIERRLVKDRVFVDATRQALSFNQNSKWFEVSFESLFSNETEDASKISTLHSLLNFLELTPQGKTDGELLYLLRKDSIGVSSRAYHAVPNILEIESKFGSPVTGFLFNADT
jgi:hypothetical protein